MEVKEWSYDEFPAFSEAVEGAEILKTTGNEMGIHYFHNVTYADMGGELLHLQILRPFSRNNPDSVLPCVVFVQGSAWMKQDVYAKLVMIAGLAEKGYAAAIVEYRHSGIAPFPAQIIDALNAVRFMKKNAAEYGVDPEKIILGGDSSGGHTAMFAGIWQNDDTDENLYPGISGAVKGIINYYGSISVMDADSNPSTVNHCLPDSPEGMEMGGANLTKHPELKRKLSFECNITKDTAIVPVLMFHGTKDRIVNTRQTVNLFRQMKAWGMDVQLYLLDGADHGGPEFWTKDVISIVDGFIQRCLK